MSIRNKRAVELARAASRMSGKSMTQIIIEALEDKLAELTTADRDPVSVDHLLAISRRCASLPTLDDRPDDEILGYGERGYHDVDAHGR
ncbi:MAG: type II toxin-antitoxin system VapB family antitoxin [Spirochaetota bacterium]